MVTTRARTREGRAVQVLLALIAISSAIVGLWAQFAPRSWYDDFPGGGRHWVAADGPYNEHLVRDVGGLNLALFVVAAIALVTGSVLVARTAALGALVYSVPHLVYHASNLDVFDSSDKVANVVALSANVLFPALVLLLLWPRRQAAG